MIFRSLDEARGQFPACGLAIGNFDGVHIGHQAVISKAVGWAMQRAVQPAVLTFHPHPATVVAPHRVPGMICPLEERLHLLHAAGAAQIMVLPFTPEVARLTPEAFVSEILVNALNAKAVFVGENFRFGHRQAGNPETLRRLGEQYGFVSHFLPPVTFRGEIVSSSIIRRYLADSRVSRAARLLGRCFSIAGPVVPGRGIGRKETVPTLNLRPAPEQIVPPGIYVSETLEVPTGRHWLSVTSAGTNPTFGGSELTVETYLLDRLEGESPVHIQVRFRRFIRPEREFASAAELKAEILRDVSQAEKYWRRLDKSAVLLAHRRRSHLVGGG